MSVSVNSRSQTLDRLYCRDFAELESCDSKEAPDKTDKIESKVSHDILTITLLLR